MNYIPKDIRIIIAGSRNFSDSNLLFEKMGIFTRNLPMFDIGVVCGEASGADSLGKQWAESNGIPVASFLADWSNLEAPGAVIRTSHTGKRYNARAGHDRNEEMAKFGTHLVVFWDGSSPGTKNMIALGERYSLKVRVVKY